MYNNFFTMLFSTIGIVATISFIIKSFLELRAYWIEGNWHTKRECFFDFCYKKVTNQPLVVCQYSKGVYGRSIDYDADDYDGESEIINMEKFRYIQIQDEIEVTLFGFKSVKAAKECLKKLNQEDRHIYELNGKVYALIEAIISEEEMQQYRAIILSDDEKYDVFMEIVDYDSRVFEFIDEEAASFFIAKCSVETIVNYLDHIFIDLSEREDLNMTLVRSMANECFGLEVSDKFLVAKLKAMKSN